MKKFSTLSLVLTCMVQSCDRLGDPTAGSQGQLCISFLDGPELFTKAYPEIPDTSDFILTITKADGNVIYEGKFGDYPEKVNIASGAYTVKVVSENYVKPAFDSPIFGDEQCIVVPSGGKADVKLLCTQLNAGIRIMTGSDFLTNYPDAALFLQSADGKLMYSYSEKRTAYFRPGNISLIMSKGGRDEVLMTRLLYAKDMLSVKLKAPSPAAQEYGKVSMDIDTSRVWLQEEYTIGMTSGSGSDEIMTVAEARNSAGKKDAWVCGYIVGGDLTSASASFGPPFESATNILLGPRSSTTDKNSCIAVQLPAGPVRDALNLSDNPGMLRKRIYIKGDITGSYYGIPGIKNTSEYRLI